MVGLNETREFFGNLAKFAAVTMEFDQLAMRTFMHLNGKIKV